MLSTPLFASVPHASKLIFLPKFAPLCNNFNNKKRQKALFIVDFTLIFAVIIAGNDALLCATFTHKPEVVLVASYSANHSKNPKMTIQSMSSK